VRKKKHNAQKLFSARKKRWASNRWGFMPTLPIETMTNACGNGSAAPHGLTTCRALDVVAIVVAAMNLVLLVAEVANMVRLAKGALTPS